VRVRPIGRPQLGHKCAELSVFPSIIVEILTSKTYRAVMAVTVKRDSRWDGGPGDEGPLSEANRKYLLSF